MRDGISFTGKSLLARPGGRKQQDSLRSADRSYTFMENAFSHDVK
jgi:hypothetical protein